MDVTVPDVLLIPHGTAAWSPEAIRFAGITGAQFRLEAPFPCIAVNRAAGAPLRLYDGIYPPTVPAPAGPGDTGPIRQHLEQLCGTWNKLATTFLAAYFRGLAALLDEHANELDAKLVPFAGLYHREDWIFSAPLPLPRAHLHAPGEDAEAGRDAFVAVDAAFWLGDRLLALVGPQTAPTPRQARTLEARLARAGIAIVRYGPGDLAAGSERALVERLLGPAVAFWRGEAVPTGPGRLTPFEF